MTISKVRLDSVFSDPFGKSASSIISYLIHTNPDEVNDNEILKHVDRHVKACGKDILNSIHDYEFIGVHCDNLKFIRKHLDDINECIRMTDRKLEHYHCKYAEIILHLATMVGIAQGSALYILGEIGTGMSIWQASATEWRKTGNKF